MKLSLGTSPFWGYELTWAGATESRDCNHPVKKQIHAKGAPCLPAQPRDPLLRLGGSHGLILPVSAWGRGQREDALSEAANLLGSPQGASGSEESASFLTKEVFKVSFRLQSTE